jgi:hypothetical protein
MNQPIFICLPDNGDKLFLQTKNEVEDNIKSVETDPDMDLSYSVIGSIKPAYKGIPYLITYKIAPSNVVLYDVVYASEGAEAHSLLLSKKRLQGKSIKITNTLDLRKLIDEYYEQ